MVAWSQLLLPIALSAVFVFIASSIIHMVLRWHAPDYRQLQNEDDVRAVIRKGGATPGQYILPYCKSSKDMQSPETMKKLEEGPNGVIYLRPTGPISLGPFLMKWVLYTVVVGILCAYFAHFTLPANAPYMDVFRVVGLAAWLAYCWSTPADSIWMGKPWISTFRYMIDGLVYALITAGTFAWLWPR